MLNFVQYTGPAIILIYLIISSNFIADIFGCQLKYILRTSPAIKHILVYLTLLFFVVSSSDWSSGHHFTELVHYSFLYYFIFILTTRLPFNILLFVLLLFTFAFYLDIYQKTLTAHNKNGLYPLSELSAIHNIKTFQKYQSILLNSSLVAIFFGFIIYFRTKQREFGSKFNLIHFFLGRTKCKKHPKRF
jgi:hypothetical protein